MPSLRDIVVDCDCPAPLARFWVLALDGYEVAPYDAEELERLRGQGIDSPEDDPTVLVEPTSGVGPRLWFQRVPEPKAVKNRVHLDLLSSDAVGDAATLVEAGATELHRVGSRITLADPEGNEFCVDEP